MNSDSHVGDNEFSDMFATPEVKVVNYDHADLDASNKLHIPVEPGLLVRSVMHEVTEVFAGGVPSMTIGDGTTADLFVVAVAPTTLGLLSDSLAGGKVGKKYNTLGEIVVTHAAGLTAGKGKVYVEIVDTRGNWRKPAL